MSRPNPPRSQNLRRSDTRSAVGTAALLLVPVACCAGPALLGATVITVALGAIGTWLLSPWLLAAAALLMLAAVGWRLRARRITCVTPTCGPPGHRPTQSVNTDRSPNQHQER